MKRVILILLTLAIVIFHWQKRTSTEQTIRRETTDQNSKNSGTAINTKNDISINLPKTSQRLPSSETSHEQTQVFLNKWWANIPTEQRHMYSMQLSASTLSHETYQVMLKNMPIEGLVIQRNLLKAQGVEPFPVFKVADDHDLIGSNEAKRKVRASDSNILSVSKVEPAWEIKPNQTLSPIYKVTADVNGAFVSQTWIVNAKTGEISSINTHTRK